MKKHTSALAAKVAAVNAANAHANYLAPLLAAALAPFMGQQIDKVEGGLLQKVKRALPVLVLDANSPALQVYRDPSNYSLRFTVKTCELYGEHSCVYHEASVFVANLRGGVAEQWGDTSPALLRTDHTEAEVFALRQALDDARKAFSAAECALYPFGSFDR